jgi:hypothetical protein
LEVGLGLGSFSEFLHTSYLESYLKSYLESCLKVVEIEGLNQEQDQIMADMGTLNPTRNDE